VWCFQEAFLIQRRLETQINALNHEAVQLRQQHTNSQARIRTLEERNSQLKVCGGRLTNAEVPPSA
jgi:FtsZ-binding cell division protein ZapB